jgi:cold shock CspA family protein
MRKSGVIRSWRQERGFGVIRVGSPSSLEKYYLHVSKIRSGTAEPAVGMEVFFDVAEALVPDGLPQAIRVDVIVPDEQPAPGDVEGGAK